MIFTGEWINEIAHEAQNVEAVENITEEDKDLDEVWAKYEAKRDKYERNI